MGMDGLSFSNTGAMKESTSADFANRTEQVIQSDPTNDAKQIQTLGTNRRVREKNEEEDESKKQEQSAEEEFEDGFVESEPTFTEEEFDIEDLENPNKDFYIKLNTKDDIIELYDSATNRLVETISGNELTELIKKLNMASGIFVNKKV